SAVRSPASAPLMSDQKDQKKNTMMLLEEKVLHTDV
ncbi:hypothetical protein A2U01_0060743, partial [Trifolium medium]|nr:hypothetical protein [Trifolium medium]